MFTSQIESEQNTQSQDSQKKTLISVCGVDVSGYKCYELNHDDPVYKGFSNTTMHYAINAMQKGLKPPTKIGLKRLKNKALKKKFKLQNPDLDPRTSRRLLSVLRKNRNKYKIKQSPAAKPLNPLSPEQLCLKALRTKFREEMEQKNEDNQNDTVNQSNVRIFAPRALLNKQQKNERHKNRKPKFIRKKQNQKKRRAQLFYLVNEYGKILKEIFPAQRLQGFYHRSKLPKISRQQIKQALTKYFSEKNQILSSQEKLTEVVEKKFQQLQEKKKRRLRRRYSGSDQEVSQNILSSSSSSSSSSNSSSDVSGSQRDPKSQAEQEEESEPVKKVKIN